MPPFALVHLSPSQMVSPDFVGPEVRTSSVVVVRVVVHPDFELLLDRVCRIDVVWHVGRIVGGDVGDVAMLLIGIGVVSLTSSRAVVLHGVVVRIELGHDSPPSSTVHGIGNPVPGSAAST